MVETPLATNTLNSLGTYFQRENYRTRVYPEGNIPKPIDLWYEKPLYGKINRSNSSIFISEAFLKQLQSEEAIPVFAANFVADAFNDLKKLFKRAEASGKIASDSQFSNLNPVSGWKNVNTAYHSYMNILYDSFVNSFISQNNREESIKDFDSFLRIFLEYIDTISPIYPISKSSFIRTKMCSSEISGLIVQIKKEDPAIDRNKYEKFILDKNFSFYTNAARQFGFLVDKNAPWRLVADLSSPAMKPYLQKYKLLNVDKLFDDLYYKSHLSDINALKIYIVQFYNSFVSTRPFIEKTKTSATIKDETILEKTRRIPLTEKDAELKLDFKFWNKLYIYMRAKEASIRMTQSEFDNLVTTTNEIEKSFDNSSAMEYVDRQFASVLNVIEAKISAAQSDRSIISFFS